MPLPSDMRANILKHELLHIIINCVVDLVAAILASARAGKIDWTIVDCLGWFLYDFVRATIISVPEWHATSYKWRRQGDTLPGTFHREITARCAEEYCEDGMSRGIAEAVWARYEAKKINLDAVLCVTEPIVFVRQLVSNRVSDASDRIENRDNNWDFEGMAIAKEVLATGVRGKLRDIQCICEEDGEAVPKTVIKVIKMAGDGIKVRRENTSLFERNSNI